MSLTVARSEIMATVADQFADTLAAVGAFQAGTAHFDDETLVVLRVL